MTDDLHILLIEDDAIDAEAVRRSLRRIASPVTLHHESDIDAGLHRLRCLLAGGDDRVLVLLDLNLPGEDGHACLRRLRADARHRQVPVIIVSTSNAEHDRRQAYAAGVCGYFVKPLDGETMDAYLRAIYAYWSCSRFPPNEHCRH